MDINLTLKKNRKMPVESQNLFLWKLFEMKKSNTNGTLCAA
jgi:hypothetical protein